MMKQRTKIRPANNKNYQLTKSGAFMLKNWPCYFGDVLYRVATIATDSMNFEVNMN